MTINPKFTFFSPLRSTKVDHCQLSEHVDHAIIALDGRAPVGGGCVIECLETKVDTSILRVELWVNEIDDFTCTYGFLISSEDGRVPYARGERTVVSIDPASHRTQKWSSNFRETHEELLKDLPAYA